MVQKPTVVKYNVDGAVKELSTLNRKVDESGKTAKKSFAIADKAADRLTAGIGKINNPAAKLSSLFSQLGISGGFAAAAISGVAVAGLSLASNFLNLPELLKDTNKQLEGLKRGTRIAQDLADLAGSISDELQLRSLEEERQLSALRRAALIEEGDKIDRARKTANEEVNIERAKLRNLESAAKASSKTREDIEKRLQDKRNELRDDAIGRGRTGGGAIADLTGEAKKAARGGDIDRAEALVERAKELSKELGNHAFFTNQIDSANNEIVRSLEKQAREAKSEETRVASAVAVQDSQLQQIEARKKALDEEFNAITRNRTLARAREQTIGIRRQQLGEQFNAAQAAADLATARKEVERLQGASATLGDIFRDFARGVPQTLLRSNQRAAELVEDFKKITGAAIIQQGILEGTPKSLERAGIAASSLQEQLSRLTVDPSFPKELQDEVEQLESLIDTVQRAAGGAALAARAGVRGGERIDTGAERITRRNQLQQLEEAIAKDAETIAKASERAATAEERAANAIERRAEAFAILTGSVLPNVPATAPVTPDAATGTAPTAAARGDTFKFNISVKGGIIDRELIEQIADIANREFRKLTAERGM